MKVYVVTRGEYSDYCISAIFSTHEKAEEYMGGFPGEFNEIEEYELDSEQPLVMGKCWVANLRLDGSEYMPTFDGVECIAEEFRSGERGYGTTEERKYGYANELDWFVGKSYVNKEHAMKLAVEQRQKALREHPEWFK